MSRILHTETPRVAAILFLIGIAGLVLAFRGKQTDNVVNVDIKGGHQTDPLDHGRPVVLIANALGVPDKVFREAFSHVVPAPAGETPDPDQVQRNKQVLLEALEPYGVTNDRLDEVSNYYRYNGRREELWRHKAAKVSAMISEGVVSKITVEDGGSGYTSKPTLTIPGFPNQEVSVKLRFSKKFDINGSIANALLVSQSMEQAP